VTQVPRIPFKGMPNILRKWYDDGGGEPDTGRFVRFYASAGKHEDRFRTYWLVGAWAMLGYQGLAMLILTVHMAFGVVGYPWEAHAIGTTVISAAYLVMACVYRFILVPHPGYLTSGHSAAAVPPGAKEQSEGASV
jgi:hypothetical protein